MIIEYPTTATGEVNGRFVSRVARRWLPLWSFLLTTCFITGCAETPFPNRQAVEGTVTIDGAPLAKALITFIPDGETKGPKSSGEVEEGEFHIAAERGPCPGDYLIKIETIPPEIEALASRDMEALRRASKQKPPPLVAEEYNVKTKLQATVREGGPNHFEYAVKSAR